jgi:hypothetical protein
VRLRLKVVGLMLLPLTLYAFGATLFQDELALTRFRLDVLLLVFMVLVILMAPPVRRISEWVIIGLGVVTFVVVKVFITGSLVVTTPVTPLLYLVELSVLFIVLKLAYDVAAEVTALQSGERVLANNLDYPPDLQSGAGVEIVKREMVRSRRFERPLGVIVLEAKSFPPTRNRTHSPTAIPESLSLAYQHFRVLQIIRSQLRIVDTLLLERKIDGFVIICPEATAADVSQLSGMISQAIYDELGFKLASGVASFPGDGLTFNKIMEQAIYRLKNHRSP